MLLNLPKSQTLISSNLHPTGTVLYFVLSSLEIFTLTLTAFYAVLPQHRSVPFVLLLYSCTLKVNRNHSFLHLEMQHWLPVFVVLYSYVSRCLAVCPKDLVFWIQNNCELHFISLCKYILAAQHIYYQNHEVIYELISK